MVAIPAVNPATVSTRDEDEPCWPVMNLGNEVAGWLEGEVQRRVRSFLPRGRLSGFRPNSRHGD